LALTVNAQFAGYHLWVVEGVFDRTYGCNWHARHFQRLK
jgi:hypothetical protein